MKDMRTVFGEKLCEIARRNDKVYVLDADLCTSTRTDLFRDEFPSRFIPMGIAEQNMMGWASGLAAEGLIPFPTTFASFTTTRALDMVRVGVCYPKLNVKLPGCYAGVPTGKAGGSHQSGEDIAIMRSLPNMRVICPCDRIELEQMLDAAVEYEGPVYIRIVKSAMPDVHTADYKFDWKPHIIRDGSDVLIVTAGFMMTECLAAAKLLEENNISAAVMNLSSIKPLQSDLLLEYAERCGCVVTAEDHSIFGGLGSAVCEVLTEHKPVPVTRIGYKDKFIESGETPDLIKKYGLSATDIANAAKDVILKK